VETLLHNFDSFRLSQGEQHILHKLKDTGKLNVAEGAVLEALEGVEPTAAVPWAEERALETLKYNNKQPSI
jgi:hypothetical protein